MNEDRGMKKWAPFQALPEHAEKLRKKRLAQQEEWEIPTYSEEEIEEINTFLLQSVGKECSFLVQKEKKLIKVSGIVKRLNVDEKRLLIEDEWIEIKEIKKIF